MKRKLLGMFAAAAFAGPAMAWSPAASSDFKAVDVMPRTYEIGPGARRAAAADGSYDYSVAVNPAQPSNCYSFKASSGYLYLAFAISEDEVARLAGDKISAISVTTGTMGGSSSSQGLSSGTVFISRDMETFAARQAIKFEKTALTVNTVELDEPYEISGDLPIYIGYIFKIASTNGYYAAVDEIPSSSFGTLVGVTSKITQFPEFSNYTDQIGSLCISATIQGTHMPYDQAQIIGSSFPTSAIVGDPYSYDLAVYNRGQNEITSVEVTTTIPGLEDAVATYELDAPLAAGASTAVTVSIPPFTEPVMAKVTSVITKVNDKENVYPNIAEGEVSCFTEGYPRKVVCEEATGTWCGWCPAGMVMMERLKELYSEDVIRIAVHQGDRMQVTNYMGFINDYVSGFPSAFMNRAIEIAPTASNVNSQTDNYIKMVTSSPTYLSVVASGEADNKVLKATATVKFSVNASVPHQISFVIVEDGVGPYDQSNYFAPGNQGNSMPMGDWNNRSNPYSTKFDDVARNIAGYPGIEGSLPEETVAGQDYVYSTDMAISNIKANEFRLVALVVNPNTGEILNADEVTIQNHGSGVENVTAESAPIVTVANGMINVAGASDVAVYTIDGKLLSTNADTVAPAGIYVVVADGRATKVAVK